MSSHSGKRGGLSIILTGPKCPDQKVLQLFQCLPRAPFSPVAAEVHATEAQRRLTTHIRQLLRYVMIDEPLS